MRTCTSCKEILGNNVQKCPYCGASASDQEMLDIKHEKIKQDMVYEEYRELQRARENYEKGGFFWSWLFGLSRPRK